jgi:hypothetical protein
MHWKTSKAGLGLGIGSIPSRSRKAGRGPGRVHVHEASVSSPSSVVVAVAVDVAVVGHRNRPHLDKQTASAIGRASAISQFSIPDSQFVTKETTP